MIGVMGYELWVMGTTHISYLITHNSSTLLQAEREFFPKLIASI